MADETSTTDDAGISKTELKSERASNLCCYSQRVCNLEKLKGFDFCHKHILEDKASPFKPCDFVAKSNERRCPNPAPKLPNRGKSFCIIHTRKAELRRAVEERRKRRRQDSIERNYHADSKEKRRRTSSGNSQRSDKVDGHSSEEEGGGGSGEEYLKVDSAWHGGIDSDADSVDSEEEDPLRHAGVWTTEEATRVCRDKMIRLRSLYIAQFKRLQHVLKERQRKYCQAIQAEEEEETGECHLTPAQLLGRKPQHERPSTEALLHRQAKEKRLGTSTRQQNMPHLRCTFSCGGNRCSERVLPLTKYCIKHITHDSNQLLFQQCAFPAIGDSACETNTPKIFNHSRCRLHLELPANMKRPHVKEDLLEAKERAKAKLTMSTAETKSDSGAVLPEALQQKSSALIPPANASQSDDGVSVSCQQQPCNAAALSVQSNIESERLGKMDVDQNIPNTEATEGSIESPTGSKTKDSTSVTLKSVSNDETNVAALENISPGLAAASLVAVCSSPQVPLKTFSLASTSVTQRSSSTAFKEEDRKPTFTISDVNDVAKDLPPIEANRAKSTTCKSQETAHGETLSSEGNTMTEKDETKIEEERKESKTSSSASKVETQSTMCSDSQDTSQSSSSDASQKTPEGVSQSGHQSTTDPSSQAPSQSPAQSSLKESQEEHSQAAVKTNCQGPCSQVVSKALSKATPESTSAADTSVKQSPQTPCSTSLNITQSVLSRAPSISHSTKTTGSKPAASDESNRVVTLKDFKHLPSGMPASSTKQFGAAITAFSRESANKDSKSEKGSSDA